MPTALNRSIVVFLTNKSGLQVSYGSVVVLNAVSSSFTLNTTEGLINNSVGVVAEPTGISNDAQGAVIIGGYVPQINLDSGCTILDFIKTSSTSGKGKPFTPKGRGAFGQALTASVNPEAILFGSILSVESYALFVDQKSAGTGGGTSTSGSWQTRTLNTVISNSDNIASLSSNQLTLQAGTYRLRARAPAYFTDRTQARWRNVTDGTTTLVGSTIYLTAGAYDGANWVEGEFTIIAAKTFELQQRVTVTSATYGFGVNPSFDENAIYATVELWKL